MTLDMVFWIALCTKMIARITAMHSVEQRRLALDDADLVERYCSELRTVRILKGVDDNGKAETVPKKNRTTLTMLLNHTGMGSNYLCNVVHLWLTGSKAGFEYGAAIRGRNALSAGL